MSLSSQACTETIYHCVGLDIVDSKAYFSLTGSTQGVTRIIVIALILEVYFKICLIVISHRARAVIVHWYKLQVPQRNLSRFRGL